MKGSSEIYIYIHKVHTSDVKQLDLFNITRELSRYTIYLALNQKAKSFSHWYLEMNTSNFQVTESARNFLIHGKKRGLINRILRHIIIKYVDETIVF